MTSETYHAQFFSLSYLSQIRSLALNTSMLSFSIGMRWHVVVLMLRLR